MMKWYWKILGGHVRVRVFMNGEKVGALCFRVDEFANLMGISNIDMAIEFIDETEADK